MQKLTVAILSLLLTTLGNPPAQAQSLKGSRASMERQNQEAVNYGYSFLRTSKAVAQFVEEGHLVRVSPNQHFELHDVSHPFARPVVKTFIERLSGQYYSACGEKLTVTSLTRPINKQPSNASSDSVHPTGMAIDLRVPSSKNCRSWLEKTLLSLEGSGVLDVTRERRPSHFHVAVFTHNYESYLASLNELPAASSSSATTPVEPVVVAAAETATARASVDVATPTVYTVKKGDTLSVIADKMHTSVRRLRTANGLRGSMIRVGQKLEIPVNSANNSANNPPNTATAMATVASNSMATTELTHRVRRGDTLWEIASRYGISASKLKTQNGLNNDLLQVGQVLRINAVASN